MNVIFPVLIIIVCILLILIVLVQNSKGGGLASNFASSNQFMGVRKTADFLEKATWTLAGTLLFLCLLSSITIKKKDTGPKSAIESSTLPNPEATPKFPAQQNTAVPAAPAAKPENKPAANQPKK